ncbi:hypothetical protein H9L39_16229 [Fusarium oxysporum f. sp. albedinis]|nr:hypothetical protein H9L39_16229 [Fusarium oxysporum f. sp. albedinis]
MASSAKSGKPMNLWLPFLSAKSSVKKIKNNDTVVKEVVYEFAPTRVDFYQPDGSKIFNIVSVDQGGNLILTFAFEWWHPQVEAESEEAKQLREKYFKMAKGAVEGTINAIRKFVKQDEL